MIMITITTIDGQKRTVKNKARIQLVWFEGRSNFRNLVTADKIKEGDYILTEGENIMKVKHIER